MSHLRGGRGEEVVDKHSVVPLRQVVSGGRVGTAYKRKEMVKVVDRLPNYIDLYCKYLNHMARKVLFILENLITSYSMADQMSVTLLPSTRVCPACPGCLKSSTSRWRPCWSRPVRWGVSLLGARRGVEM